MVKTLRKILLPLGFLLAGGAILAACGSSDKMSGEKVLRASFGGYLGSLDPQKAQGTWDRPPTLAMFDTLFIHDMNAVPIPSLAESFTVSDGGKTYTFHLRKNAAWSDGSPLSASDVVFSFRRVVDPAEGNTYAFILGGLLNAREIMAGKMDKTTLGVKALDDHTVEVHLASPLPFFPDLLTHQVAAIIPPKAVEAYGQAWTHPDHIIASGAFMMGEYVPKEHLTVVKNPHFWGAADVALDKVTFYPMEDSAVSLRRYKAGDLDLLVDNIPANALKDLQDDPDLSKELTIHNRLGTEYYILNSKTGKFSDPNVRKALSLAIDREKLVEEVLHGFGVPALGIIPYGIANYKDTQHAKLEGFGGSYEERLSLAKKLMEDAGYSESKPLEFKLNVNNDPVVKSVAVAVSAFWKEIYVHTTMFSQDTAVHFHDIQSLKHEVARGDWKADYNDPSTYTDLYTSENPFLGTGLPHSDYDALAAKVYTVPLGAEREKIIHDAEEVLLKEGYTIPLYFMAAMELHKPHVKNFAPNASGDYHVRLLDVE